VNKIVLFTKHFTHNINSIRNIPISQKQLEAGEKEKLLETGAKDK